jgi:hypothetical protein
VVLLDVFKKLTICTSQPLQKLGDVLLRGGVKWRNPAQLRASWMLALLDF